MSKYINEKCPVCQNVFEDGDDIVVCPECGTPHHRDCYNKIHHCANASKHKEGFVYEVSAKENEDNDFVKAVKENIKKETENKDENNEQRVCHICGEPVEDGATMCINCGAVLENAKISGNYANFTPDNAMPDEIDGEPVSDIAAAVGANATRFIPKFIENKKLSWNWSAFIFGPYYFFYRKMYRPGIVAMIISLATNFICQGLYAEKYAKFAELAQSQYYRDAVSNPFSNMQKLTELSQDPVTNAVMPMFVILFILALLIRVFCALLSDSLYRQHTLRTVRVVNERIKKGDYFAPGPFSMNAQQPDLNQNQMKLLFLNRKGGVSVFAPIAAYFALDLLMSFILGL